MGHRILLAWPTDVDTEMQRDLGMPAQVRLASGHTGTVCICLAFFLLRPQTPLPDGKFRMSGTGGRFPVIPARDVENVAQWSGDLSARVSDLMAKPDRNWSFQPGVRGVPGSVVHFLPGDPRPHIPT